MVADAQSFSIAGRSILITGGSKGIGKEAALALSRAGADVAITGRHRANLEAVENDVMRGAGQIIGIVADVRQISNCESTVRIVERAFGKIDALINNAGIALAGMSDTFNETPLQFWKADEAAWRAVMDTNTLGPFLMTKTVIPSMLTRGSGRIINVSSSPAVMRRQGWSPYGASKAALESLSITWAQELAGTGVTVNVVRPGGQVDTAIFPGGGKSPIPREGFLGANIMNELLIWLVSDASGTSNGKRFSGQLWDKTLPPAAAARGAMLPYPEPPFLF